MQVRPGGEAGRADLRNHASALYALAARDQDLRAVGVARHETTAVVDGQHVAVALFPLDVGDDAGSRRLDRGAHLRGHVDALVWPRQVEDRMDTLASEGA